VHIRLQREGGTVVGAEITAPERLSVRAEVSVQVASRSALRNAKPNWAAHERVLPPAGTDGVYAYWRGSADGELHARMFSPLDATIEDPATSSATGPPSRCSRA
jgi:trans-2,3-dihydro-3-hydroxyanthranilate isomerase